MSAAAVLDEDARLLAQKVADIFAEDPRVEAVVLGGSHASGAQIDSRSDIDLAVYSVDGEFSIEQRRAVVERLGGAARASMGLTFWGSGDVWFDARSGIEVDVVYSSQRWLEQALERILIRHEPSGAYTTCAWHSALSSRILFDRSGWFARLQAWSDQPYPPELRQAIIAHILPLLREIIPSYRWNLEKSLPRRDLVYINNEVTWMLASYFDLLFAFNCVPNPGAKRLVEQAERLCPRLPRDMAVHIKTVLRLAAAGDAALLDAVDRLVDGLEDLVREG